MWNSEAQGNLYFTIVLRPLSARDLGKLNFAICLAVATAAQSQGVAARVKWPNDIWISNRKTSGVLVDVDITGAAIAVYAGVGINVNQKMGEHPNAELRKIATSIADAAGKEISREQLLADVCNELEQLLSQDMKDILALYKKFDMLIGHEVTVMPKKREDTESYYQAIASGFTEDGYLRVKVGSNEEKVLVSEEVTVKPK